MLMLYRYYVYWARGTRGKVGGLSNGTMNAGTKLNGNAFKVSGPKG